MDKLDNVIVHVGGNNLREAKELAQHAEQIGANAISSLPTVFLRPKNVQALVEYLRELSEAAPTLPLYYYHIPSMSGVNLCMEELLDAIGDSIPTFRGMKYTAADLHDFGRCITHSNGKYDMLYGNDESILAALSFGGKGFVGSTYNYSGKMCNRVIDAFNKRDLETARSEMFKVQAFVSVLKKYGGSVDANKCIMVLSGLDVGPPRLPLIEFTKENRENLQKDLEAVGFFGLI
ncbi:N-acetylneuraminate lyase-like [Saccoglossus kowalevskii]